MERREEIGFVRFQVPAFSCAGILSSTREVTSCLSPPRGGLVMPLVPPPTPSGLGIYLSRAERWVEVWPL